MVSEKSFVSGDVASRRISMRPLSAIFGEVRTETLQQDGQQQQHDYLDTILEQDPLPPHADIEEILNMTVMDQHRLKIPLGQLVKDKDERRVVMVFIRHFFCGVGLPIHFTVMCH